MDVTGQLLDIEHKSGNFTPQGATESVAYDNVTAYMIVGRRQVKIKARGDDRSRLLALRESIGKQVTIPVLLPDGLTIAPLT